MVRFQWMQTARSFAVVTAIALTAPFSTPAEDHGRIYVYAQRPTAARSWLPITCNGAAVAELKQGMVFAIDVPPGRHYLSTEMSVPMFVAVRSGEEIFVRLDWEHRSDGPPIPVLTAVRPDRAHKEMMHLSYISAKRVLSTSVRKTDPRAPTQLHLKRRPEQ